ncbi:MAG: hypothetical protein QG553_564 [Patescibacteria group bacterium]|nr:hypothetical protein [Patescibacteria group bacterium]
MKSPLSLPKPKLPKPKLPFIIRRVSGRSMEPTFRPGKLVLIWQWSTKPTEGRIVVIKHNGLEKIKRVQQVRSGQIFVVGDNQDHSTDSRQFGWLDQACITGRVLF